jgi:hypothetical protein
VADENARELIETGIVHKRSKDKINHRQARNSIAYHLRRSRISLREFAALTAGGCSHSATQAAWIAE